MGGVRSFLEWQWQDYARNHQNPDNLRIHLVAVPLFVAGTLSVPVSLALGAWWLAPLGVVATIVSLRLQQLGHAKEEFKPPPFRGRADFWIRMFAEQYITFPRLLLAKLSGNLKTGNSP